MSQVDPADWPGYLIKKVQQRVRQYSDAELRATGLSFAHYVVLRELDRSPGASSAEIARRCFVTPQSLRELLGTLTERGWTASAAPTRGRARPVALTPDGQAMLRVGGDVMAAVEARMVSGLSAADVERLTALLTVCSDNLAPDGRDPH